MDSIGSILPRVLHRRGLRTQAQAAHVTHKATLWLAAALPQLCDQLRVEHVKDGLLVLSASHPIAAQECVPLLPGLREYLERECTAAVREVRLIRKR